MEQEKLNWIIFGIAVLVVFWIFSSGSRTHYGMMNAWGGYGMMGFGYGSILSSLVMFLAAIVLILAAVWLFKQITSTSRGKKR